MIKGTGIDIIELARIKKAIMKNPRFINRILTYNEQEKYHSYKKEFRKIEFLAGRFAAKEAFSKAVGSGIGKLSFQHIEILPNELGKPEVRVKGFEKEHIFLSISHSKAYVVAHVLITTS